MYLASLNSDKKDKFNLPLLLLSFQAYYYTLLSRGNIVNVTANFYRSPDIIMIVFYPSTHCESHHNVITVFWNGRMIQP